MTTLRDAGELLRHHGLRVTPQRRAILDAFRGTPDEHLSAEEVLSRAGVAVPEIGRGTVYAALAELTELRLLSSVGQVEPIRYETNVDPHDHFHCRLCLRLFDLDPGSVELLSPPPEGYSVESVTVRVEGICAGCRDYHRGLAAGVRSVKRHPTLDADTLGHLSCAVVESPIGELALGASGDGIVHVAFADHADFDPMSECAGPQDWSAAGSRLRLLGDALQRYLAGSDAPLTEAVDWRLIEPATAHVLRQVCQIPYGESSSYEHLWSDVSPYRCGLAMGKNPLPLLIPCHRVSCGPSRPDIYVGGPERLHFLHRLEGVRI